MIPGRTYEESYSRASTGSTPAVGTLGNPEVSVVMPCLNEIDTLATCISKAQRALVEHGDRWRDHRRR